MRASIVDKPFSARTNTKNNTPAIVHTEIVPGDSLRIQVMPVGAAAEHEPIHDHAPNAGKDGSRISCCRPLRSREEPASADHRGAWGGRNGGTRDVHGEAVADTADRGGELRRRAGGVRGGAAGNNVSLGRRLECTQTALAVHMETHPTHIASLPVAVNLQCHSARLKEAVL